MSQKINHSLFQDTFKVIQQTDSSSLFNEAIQEDSNREDTWLWYAGQVTSPLERRYCLERALYINPYNWVIANVLKSEFQNTSKNMQIQRSVITRLLVALSGQ